MPDQKSTYQIIGVVTKLLLKVEIALRRFHRDYMRPKKISCPSCEKMIETKIPQRHECAFCGMRFEIDQDLALHEIDEEGTSRNHIPNKIPKDVRRSALIISAVTSLISWFGLVKHQIDIPVGKRRVAFWIHLQGDGVVLASFGLLILAISWISVVIDHYDLRENEIGYRYVFRYGILISTVLVILAVAVEVVQGTAGVKLRY